MIQYKVTERKDHRFDFTCSDRGNRNIFPVGYCSRYRDTFNSELTADAFKFIEKHHTNGHATKQEAADCYKEYQLDHRLTLMVNRPDAIKPCEVCGKKTPYSVNIGGDHAFDLCEKHNNREEVAKLYRIDANQIIWEQ